jgi:hypothetical protein
MKDNAARFFTFAFAIGCAKILGQSMLVAALAAD